MTRIPLAITAHAAMRAAATARDNHARYKRETNADPALVAALEQLAHAANAVYCRTKDVINMNKGEN